MDGAFTVTNVWGHPYTISKTLLSSHQQRKHVKAAVRDVGNITPKKQQNSKMQH